jgi:hypothetical protein
MRLEHCHGITLLGDDILNGCRHVRWFPQPPLLRGLKDTFEAQGYEVLTAQNGEKGLDLALTGNPSLILLDIMLPAAFLHTVREFGYRFEFSPYASRYAMSSSTLSKVIPGGGPAWNGRTLNFLAGLAGWRRSNASRKHSLTTCVNDFPVRRTSSQSRALTSSSRVKVVRTS